MSVVGWPFGAPLTGRWADERPVRREQSVSERGPSPAAVAVVAQLAELGATVGCAESLTGGLLCGALTDVPGASAVVRGGVVSYTTDVKESVLGVDGGLLAHEGAVHAEVALQMARGVCRVVRSSVGVATTGVAGPTEQDGQPVGRVFVAVVAGQVERVRRFDFEGGRPAIRQAAVREALALLSAVLEGPPVFAPDAAPGETPDEATEGTAGELRGGASEETR